MGSNGASQPSTTKAGDLYGYLNEWEARLDDLRHACQSHCRPGIRQLREYLVGIPADQHGDMIVNLAAEHLQQSWQAGWGAPLDEYLAELGPDFPELQAVATVPAELVLAEFLARHSPVTGDYPRLEEYRHRFAERPSVFDQILSRSLDGGRFIKLKRIGAGGMGQVWLAYDHALRRHVAIKEPLLDDERILHRLEQEARVTAGLEHPAIVAVHEYRQPEEDVPFYVMRWVHGQTLREVISAYHGGHATLLAGEGTLQWQRLLQAFLTVCDAIGYAHARGVLHRDLKPENVRIGSFGEAVVLDWGLGKRFALQEESTHSPAQIGGIVRDSSSSAGVVSNRAAGQTPLTAGAGTLSYMAPEQVDGQADWRSDVFGLGAILYEILTGRAPYEAQDDGGSPPLHRRVQECRLVPPRRIQGSIPAALEAVCLRAMARDPADRYQSADDLARDVRRHLSDEPVTAWAEPWLVRAGRWARRHRMFMTGAVAVLLAAVAILAPGLAIVAGLNNKLDLANSELADTNTDLQGALADATSARDRANEEKRSAEAVLGFLEREVIAAARPLGQEGGRGHGITLRKAVEMALPSLDASFQDQPLIEARLRFTLGLSFACLGEPTMGVQQLELALALQTRHLGADHPDRLLTMNKLATCYVSAGRYPEALKLREETLMLQTAKLGQDHPHTLETMNELGGSYADIGRHQEALRFKELALARRKALLGLDHVDTLRSMDGVAFSYASLGRHAEALQVNQEALARMRATLGPDHPDTIRSMIGLAFRHAAFGRYEQALSLHEEALTRRRTQLGADHPDTFRSMAHVGNAHADLGRHGEALPLLESALRLQTAKLGPDHPDTLRTQLALGRLHVRTKAYEQAEVLLLNHRQSVEQSGTRLPQAWRSDAMVELVRLYDAWHKPELAASMRAGLPAQARIRDGLEQHYAWAVLWNWPRF